MGLWLPPAVAEELRDNTSRYKQRLLRNLTDEEAPQGFGRALKELDERLFVARAKGIVETGLALKPGHWHIFRDNDGAPPSVMTLEGEHGEYVEPTSRVLDRLRENDLQRPGALQERFRRQQKEEEAEQRRQEQEEEAFDQDVLERWKAARRVQVSMNPDTPWTQNARGRRRV